MRTLFALASLTSLLQLIVLASPVTVNITSRDVPADPLSKYTTDYFISQRRFDPSLGTCMYYTFNLGEYARRFTQPNSVGYITIWDVWACDFYNLDTNDLNNPIREIVANPQDKVTYFENMSRAYAFLCSGYGLLFTEDINNIPDNGIWGRIEFPTVKRNTDFAYPKGKVEFIEATTQEQKEYRLLYDRANPPPRARDLSVVNSTTANITARSPPDKTLPYCVQPEDVDTLYGFLEPAPPETGPNPPPTK